FMSYAQDFGLKKVSRDVAGHGPLAQSVLCGLASIPHEEIVDVQDDVRPHVAAAEIDATMHAARANGAAILTAAVGDTIKEIEGHQVIRTLPRANLRRALTPQCFRYEILKRAYDQLNEVEASGIELTDD